MPTVFYTTSVVLNEHELTLASVPPRSLPFWEPEAAPEEAILNLAGREEHIEIVVWHELGEIQRAERLSLMEDRLRQVLSEIPGADDLVQYVLTTPQIPVEMSRLSGETLARLVEQSPAGAGAAIGFVAAGGPAGGPLLLLTVPAGIIGVSASVYVSRWLKRKLGG